MSREIRARGARRLALLLVGVSGSAAGEEATPLEQKLAPCRQVVVVSARDWDASEGVLTAWSRTASGWRSAPRLTRIRVTLGKRGLGIGVGLHPAGEAGRRDASPRQDEPRKIEGDRKAPAGIFPLESSFGRGPRPLPRERDFFYRRTTARDLWIDDPGSHYYNRRIDPADPEIRADWKSAERLLRPDGLYDLVIVVGHNRRPILPGRGSAIFLHRWSRPGIPTIGCTAMAPDHLRELWRWLDSDAAPLLIQGPESYLDALTLPAGLRVSR